MGKRDGAATNGKKSMRASLTGKDSGGCGGWMKRNVVHIVLLALAVGAVGTSVLLSLDSCNTDVTNRTVTTNYTISYIVQRNVTQNVTVARNSTINETVTSVTPLSVFIAIDASNSMAWDDAGSNRAYITTDGTGPTQQFSCKSDQETCYPTPTAVTSVSLSYDPTAEGDRFDHAKEALPQILTALDSALNNETLTNAGTNLKTGVLQWARDNRGVIYESELTHDVNTTKSAIAEMVINGGGNTCWGPGLCQCYSLLVDDSDTANRNASKLCILVSDGDLYPNSCEYGNGLYDDTMGAGLKMKDNTPIAISDAGGGFCAKVYNEWTAEGNSGLMSTDDISTFIKSKGVTIYGTFVGAYDAAAAQDMFTAASCDTFSFPGNAASECPYYSQVADFEELASKSAEIASYQLSIATQTATRTEIVTEEETRTEVETQNETLSDTNTETTSEAESVSICSLDFLWALAAFGPFLAYLLYRLFSILTSRKKMKRKLLKMIRAGDMNERFGPAGAATRVLLPGNFPIDIDFGISWLLFTCFPCLLPLNRDDLENAFQTTIAL